MGAGHDSNDKGSRLLAAFCRHVISLTWVDENTEARRLKLGKNERDAQAFAVSAFVISIRDIWFLVTAGHIIRQLEQRLADGRRIVTARLVDGIGAGASLPAIPFPLTESPRWCIDENGLDYALFPLRPAYACPLMAGGVLALDEDGWADPPKTADAYFMLGFPADAIETSVAEGSMQGNAFFRLATPLLPLQQMKDPPEQFEYQPNRFFARVPVFTRNDEQETKITDIKGMSGGPIFAVQFDNRGWLRYWVIAVQSRWLRESRVIAACPIQPIADAIAKSMTDHAAELEGHELPKREEATQT